MIWKRKEKKNKTTKKKKRIGRQLKTQRTTRTKIKNEKPDTDRISLLEETLDELHNLVGGVDGALQFVGRGAEAGKLDQDVHRSRIWL